MATGEGKTLAGALAAAGYALRGRSVHVMSVNDYLARRDAEWMRPVYDLLGVTVGWIGQVVHAGGAAAAPTRPQVTYAPVSEIGFDVLRDRLVTDAADLVAARPGRGPDRRGRLGADRRGAGAAGAGRARPRSADADAEMARDRRRAATPGSTTRSTRTPATCTLTEAGAQAAEQALGGIDLYTERARSTR